MLTAIAKSHEMAAQRVAASTTALFEYVRSVLEVHGTDGLERRFELEDGESVSLVDHINNFLDRQHHFMFAEGYNSDFEKSRKKDKSKQKASAPKPDGYKSDEKVESETEGKDEK